MKPQKPFADLPNSLPELVTDLQRISRKLGTLGQKQDAAVVFAAAHILASANAAV